MNEWAGLTIRLSGGVGGMESKKYCLCRGHALRDGGARLSTPNRHRRPLHVGEIDSPQTV